MKPVLSISLGIALISLLMGFMPGNHSSLTWEPCSNDEVAKAFKQSENWYRDNTSYSVKVTHASYKDYTTEVAADQSTGYFKKEGNNYYSYLLGIHTIQNEKYKVVIDTLDKLITITNTDKLMNQSFSMVDLETLKKTSQSMKVATIGNEKVYRLEFGSGYPFAAYEIKINKEGLVHSIALYYNRSIKDPNDKNSPGAKPRVSITFSDYKTKTSFSKNEFDAKQYITMTGNKPIATERYKGFKVQDNRLK